MKPLKKSSAGSELSTYYTLRACACECDSTCRPCSCTCYTNLAYAVGQDRMVGTSNGASLTPQASNAASAQ